MKRALIGWLMAATMGYWVMTTGGEKFDGPFRYGADCLRAAQAFYNAGYNVAYFCRYYSD